MLVNHTFTYPRTSGQGNYYVVLKDAAGDELRRYPFELSFDSVSDKGAGRQNDTYFVKVVEYLDGLKSMARAGEYI